MSNYDSSARDDLLRLLRLKLGNEIDYDHFRIAVEEIYNFRLDPRSATELELRVFERLFDAVTRYSPFPEDRAAYPSIYKDEQHIDEVVDQVRRELGIEVA